MSLYMDVIMAGFGGQGVILIGNLLAYAAMDQGLNVTFMPVYGAEMRGGTSNCTVVVAEEEIGSPIIRRPKSTIILNRPSLDKFQPRLEDGGVQVVNTSLVDEALLEKSGRIRTARVPANDIADRLGNARLLNMVALGAYIKATGVLSLERVQESLHHVVSKHYLHLLPKNAEALKAGFDEAAL